MAGAKKSSGKSAASGKSVSRKRKASSKRGESSTKKVKKEKGYESNDEADAHNSEASDGEQEDLVYAKGTLIAYRDSTSDLNFSIARLLEDMKLEDTNAKVELFEIKDEDKLQFALLDPTS